MFRVTKFLLLILVLYQFAAGQSVNIVSRSEWGARPPKSTENLSIDPPEYVIIHHSETGMWTGNHIGVQNIQAYHMDHRKWDDIGYNFLIGSDGAIYEGRGFGIRGAHSPSYNHRSLGICLLGNFMNRTPTAAAINAAHAFLNYSVSMNKLASNYTLLGHRQTRQTDCPGDRLYELIQTWSHWKNIDT